MLNPELDSRSFRFFSLGKPILFYFFNYLPIRLRAELVFSSLEARAYPRFFLGRQPWLCTSTCSIKNDVESLIIYKMKLLNLLCIGRLIIIVPKTVMRTSILLLPVVARGLKKWVCCKFKSHYESESIYFVCLHNHFVHHRPIISRCLRTVSYSFLLREGFQWVDAGKLNNFFSYQYSDKFFIISQINFFFLIFIETSKLKHNRQKEKTKI